MPNAELATGEVDQLAESLEPLAEPVVNPVLVIISGLPGTGKTYFSQRLTERIPLAILESDALRRVLFSSPTYSAGESAHLFQVIHSLISRLLRKGISLILDATNLSEKHRKTLYSIADSAGARLVLVSIDAPAEVVRRRMELRCRNPENKSDADWATYQKMQSSVSKIHRQHFTVDTSRDITPTLDAVARIIKN